MRCDSFLDEDYQDCPLTPNGEHQCVLENSHPMDHLSLGHLDAHQCDCGVTW